MTRQTPWLNVLCAPSIVRYLKLAILINNSTVDWRNYFQRRGTTVENEGNNSTVDWRNYFQRRGTTVENEGVLAGVWSVCKSYRKTRTLPL